MIISNQEILVRLLTASLLGGIIGLEREMSRRPAGFRTHVLVSLGAALIMLISAYAFDGADPSRMAAQVVSGVGFLGAGTIMFSGDKIKGLTTAASIWLCAAIGLASGAGFYYAAGVAVVLSLFVLLVAGFFERMRDKKKYKHMRLTFHERTGLIGDIGHISKMLNVLIKDIHMSQDSEGVCIVDLVVDVPPNTSYSMLVLELSKIEGVIEVV
jgi:putative Mg2+ transporter-C (MgtC) family protein